MLYLLIVYIAFLIAYIVYSALAIYHLKRFGYVGDLTKAAIFIYTTISVTIIVLSVVVIMTRSWPATFNL